jgi:hypothetical protein
VLLTYQTIISYAYPHCGNILTNILRIYKYNTWLVKYNPYKTEIMTFNIRNQQGELSFDFDGIVVNSVNKCIY